MLTQAKEYLKRSQYQYDAAFHLLHVTMPVVNDPKLMVGILSNLNSSLDLALDAILTYEWAMQLSPKYHNTFNGKFNNFSQKTVKRYRIPQQYVDLILSTKEAIDFYKQGPIDFPRQDKLIVCNKDYQYRSLSLPELKVKLDLTRDFLAMIADIINNRKLSHEQNKI
jgi:hypothetical protein